MGADGVRSGGRVLVVEDDESVRTMLTRVLALEGYAVEPVATVAAAVAALRDPLPDLVLLDLVLAGEDGLDLLTRIRRDHDVPVILLTGRAEEHDRILGLRMGADDYIVKPFSPGELVARIQTVLRRARPRTAPRRLEFSGLEIDLDARDVSVNGTPVALTAKEFDLLACLAGAPRQVFTRPQLLDRVWDSSPEWQDDATVTEHIRRLRRKIEPDPDRPRWVRTVRGVGYRFEA